MICQLSKYKYKDILFVCNIYEGICTDILFNWLPTGQIRPM